MSVTPPRTLTELFIGFVSIGARSFGGVLPWAFRVMVEERRWVTTEDFTQTMGLCQFLPGPNVGNAAIVYGKRWFGARGAAVAAFGLFALPFTWVVALGALYSDYASNAVLRAVVTGVGAAGAGFFLATAIKLARPLARKPAALLIIAGCFLSVGIGRISLAYVLPIAILVALACSRWGRL